MLMAHESGWSCPVGGVVSFFCHFLSCHARGGCLLIAMPSPLLPCSRRHAMTERNDTRPENEEDPSSAGNYSTFDHLFAYLKLSGSILDMVISLNSCCS